MTIQRQYSLPNCTLLLEGLGDLSLDSQPEARPLMSVLINAECHLPGQEKPLTGGRDFLEGLVTAVSHYAQEILSGVHDFSHARHNPSLVQLQRVDENHHLLSVLPEGADPGSGIATQLTRQIKLSTVQLFDLVEAIDQFFADTQTLPDLPLNLKPLPKRYVRGGESVGKQAVPAALGLSGVALAAIACFAIPVPKINQPVCFKPGAADCPKKEESNASPTASPSPDSSPTGSPQANAASPRPSAPPNQAELEAVLTNAPEITDPKEVESLQERLRQQLDDAWKTRTPVAQDLVYRVGVNKDGAIMGYKPINPAAVTNANKTPLLDLLSLPQEGESRSANDAIAQYKVLFTSSGVVDVAPWKDVTASPLAKANGTEITDNQRLENLLENLRGQLYDKSSQETKPSYTKELVFKVRVKDDGTVVDYKPDNQPAYDYIQETALPQIGKPADDGGVPLDTPHAIFKVVFKPGGTVEISPWRGWQPE